MATKNIIIKVEKGGIAEEMGIEVGDELISVNGAAVEDVFDYRYLMNDDYVEILLKDANGEEYIAEIEKDFDEDIGVVFESGLMDDARSCRNKCVFCFIDQMPPNMRETLYFKDDDTRLSFLQGNYATLTNMADKDIDHIIFYHLSPINISVHTTDGELRKKMLNNKNADKLMANIKKLTDAGIETNMQVVACRGINDGEVLEKTIADLAQFMPKAKSLSVVPVGLSKFREGLYPLTPYDKQSSKEVIDIVEKWQKKLRRETGCGFVYAADEFYINAGLPLPPVEDYDGFPQYENGVGMISLMESEFDEELAKLNAKLKRPKTVSLATGAAAFPFIKKMCEKLESKVEGLKINAYEIVNDFFGDTITVSGLLTGKDITEQLADKELGEYLVLPDSLLRNGETVLLDDITIEDIEKMLNIKIRVSKNGGGDFISALLNLEEE